MSWYGPVSGTLNLGLVWQYTILSGGAWLGQVRGRFAHKIPVCPGMVSNAKVVYGRVMYGAVSAAKNGLARNGELGWSGLW